MIHGQYTDYKHTCFAQICVANHIHKDIPPPYNLPLCKHIQTHSFNLISLLPNSNTAQATPQRRSPCDTNNLSSTHTHTHTHTHKPLYQRLGILAPLLPARHRHPSQRRSPLQEWQYSPPLFVFFTPNQEQARPRTCFGVCASPC
jgi:hypothetical protein